MGVPVASERPDDVVDLDVEAIRADFPILSRQVNGKPLAYLDSGNTSQKPRQVIDAMSRFAQEHNANIARAVHQLGTEANDAFEGARQKVADFICAPRAEEVVFTKNSTEAINLVAYSMLAATLSGGDPRFRLGPGDEIVISEMEHHSNIVPWQMLCERTGATLKWFSITDSGRMNDAEAATLITERTKLVSFVHMSNILGTVNPTSRITQRAREVGALVMLDASQSVPHMPVDVVAADVDFIAFTGHKMCGPTGIGVLWGKHELLEIMPPFLGGGSMIGTVTMERSTYAPPPARFEAGTPPIIEAVGLGAAIDYLTSLDMRAIQWHEKELVAYALPALETVPGLRILGPRVPIGRGGAISFDLEGIHTHDVGQVLDAHGVAVRVGHHCAKPTCARFGVAAATRASFYLYTPREEIDRLVDALQQTRKVFG